MCIVNHLIEFVMKTLWRGLLIGTALYISVHKDHLKMSAEQVFNLSENARRGLAVLC